MNITTLSIAQVIYMVHFTKTVYTNFKLSENNVNSEHLCIHK